MNQHLDTPEGVEHHDYDAVCEACDEVNPPGTLLCKTCGNNLRDQQQRRFATQGAPEIQDESLLRQPRRFMAALLTVFGILIIVWTMMNVVNGNIERWLTEVHMSGTVNASSNSGQRFWTGESAPVFDDMARALERSPITAEEIEAAALAQPGQPQTGRYYLMDGNYEGAAFVGQGYVYCDVEEIYFVATIPPGYEVRGIASYDLEALEVGIRYQDQYASAVGQGQILEDGSIACYGEAGVDSIIYQAVAFFVP
jgi:hypothetical protein